MIKSGLLNLSSSRYGPAQFTQHGCFEDDFLLSILTIRQLFLRWSILGFNIYSNKNSTIGRKIHRSELLSSPFISLQRQENPQKLGFAWRFQPCKSKPRLSTQPALGTRMMWLRVLAGCQAWSDDLWCSSIPVPGSFTNLPAVLATETCNKPR